MKDLSLYKVFLSFLSNLSITIWRHTVMQRFQRVLNSWKSVLIPSYFKHLYSILTLLLLGENAHIFADDHRLDLLQPVYSAAPAVREESFQVSAVGQNGIVRQARLHGQIVQETLDFRPQWQSQQFFSNRLCLRWGHFPLLITRYRQRKQRTANGTRSVAIYIIGINATPALVVRLPRESKGSKRESADLALRSCIHWPKQ